MIQYRVCVDKDSEWFEYRDTFEEALQVLRDLFEEAGKVFYQGFTNWTSISRNGNRSCQVRFAIIDNDKVRFITHGILMMDTEYKARKAEREAASKARYDELNKLNNRAIFDMVAKGPADNRSDFHKACAIMSERTGWSTMCFRPCVGEFDDYCWPDEN